MKKLKRGQNGRREKSRFDERWGIVGVLGLTVSASLLFYLKAELPRIWHELTDPRVISSLPSPVETDSSLLVSQIKDKIVNLQGTYGFYVYQLKDGASFGWRENEVFPAASLIKLPVMLTLYQEAEKGKIKLADYQEMAEAMGKRSDNTAFNQLVKILGEDKIQETIDILGMTKTSLAKNETSPADMGLFFKKLYQDRLVTEAHRDQILDHLTNTIFDQWLPAGVPAGVTAAHKVGIDVGIYADAGLVFAERPFVLVIMSQGARKAEAQAVIPKITKMVWEFETR
jgi:beta-lactamase class A